MSEKKVEEKTVKKVIIKNEDLEVEEKEGDISLEIGEKVNVVEGIPFVENAGTEFDFGVCAFHGVFKSNLIPKVGSKINVKWIARDIPGQGKNILLREVKMVFEEKFKKIFTKIFYASTYMELGVSGQKFPVGTYKLEVFQDEKLVKSKIFKVKDKYLLNVGLTANPKPEEVAKSTTYFKFKHGTIHAHFQSPSMLSGEGRISWIYVKSFSISNKSENFLLLVEKFKADKFDRVSSKLPLQDVDPGLFRCEVYLTVDKKEVLMAYKDFCILPFTEMTLGSDANEKGTEIKGVSDIFPSDCPKICGLCKANCLFPGGSPVQITWWGLDVDGMERNHVISREKNKIKTQFTMSFFQMNKPGKKDFNIGAYKVESYIDLISKDEKVFLIGTSFSSELGEEYNDQENGMKEGKKEFKVDVDSIKGICKSNKKWRKDTPFSIKWIAVKVEDKEISENHVFSETESKIEADEMDKILFSISKPKTKEKGFPKGEFAVEIRIYGVLVDRVKFSIL